MPTVGLVYSGRYLQHNTNPYRLPISGEPLPFVEQVDHPSNPRLVERTMKLLDMSDIGQHLQMISPYSAPEPMIALYHTQEYIERVAALSETGGGDAGQGAPVGVDSYQIALLAAGGAMAAVDAVMGGDVSRAYALVRPPGHHAMSDKGMGFCIFNNVVIAAHHARRTYGLERVMIYDWDVHHGNGTQDAFYDDPSVLFISTHQDRLYPEQFGHLDQNGEGEGVGKTVNIPLPAGCGDAAYLAAVEEIITPVARQFQPELILVSAGQDASSADPLGRMSVTAEGYRKLTAAMIALATELCDGRLAVVQEGGYSETYAPYCTLAILEALTEYRSNLEEPVNQERADRWPQSQSVGLDARAALDAVKQQYAGYWDFA
jgi:acetoin utilization deacetylase AcuC-like enzyme